MLFLSTLLTAVSGIITTKRQLVIYMLLITFKAFQVTFTFSVIFFLKFTQHSKSGYIGTYLKLRQFAQYSKNG